MATPRTHEIPEGATAIYCSTELGIRKCKKFLGYSYICFEWKYCKSCKQMNYYEVITEKGLEIAHKI